VANPKVFEFAKEIGMTPLALMDKIREWQFPVKSHMAELEPEILEQIKIKLSGGDKASEEKPKKVAAKKVAIACSVPIIEGNKAQLNDATIATIEAKRIGLPVMLKAAAGGGGRGMRVVRNMDDLEKSFNEAKREAANAFGDDTIFIEKFVDDPKHIEVQILGDTHGNIVHLHERDCSVQRRFQKVVEVAPAPTLKLETNMLDIVMQAL
jgi:acetyl/propionyl-CoA carboxylase alpha subunit